MSVIPGVMFEKITAADAASPASRPKPTVATAAKKRYPLRIVLLPPKFMVCR
jgi:hypothetical protein